MDDLQNTNGVRPKTVVNNTSVPNEAQSTQKKVMKEFPKNKSSKQNMFLVIGALGVILVGVATGWTLTTTQNKNAGLGVTSEVAPGAMDSENEAGIMDESGFEEEAPEGILMEGGINGEGTHYIDRGMGENKNVYLTSTVLDLQSFVGKKVKVWGNTVAAIDAPWLMDVGKIKVVK